MFLHKNANLCNNYAYYLNIYSFSTFVCEYLSCVLLPEPEKEQTQNQRSGFCKKLLLKRTEYSII